MSGNRVVISEKLIDHVIYLGVSRYPGCRPSGVSFTQCRKTIWCWLTPTRWYSLQERCPVALEKQVALPDNNMVASLNFVLVAVTDLFNMVARSCPFSRGCVKQLKVAIWPKKTVSARCQPIKYILVLRHCLSKSTENTVCGSEITAQTQGARAHCGHVPISKWAYLRQAASMC